MNDKNRTLNRRALVSARVLTALIAVSTASLLAENANHSSTKQIRKTSHQSTTEKKGVADGDGGRKSTGIVAGDTAHKTSSSAQGDHEASPKPGQTPKSTSGQAQEKEVRSAIRTNQSLHREMLSAAKANDPAAAKAALANAGFKNVENLDVARTSASSWKYCFTVGGHRICIKMP